jgi:hypothetical protein
VADKKRTVSIVIQARNEAGKILDSIIGSLSSFAGLATVAAVGAGYMALALKRVTEAASEQEKADVALAQALSSIGQNTAEVREDLAAFIDSMEDLTKVNDETISSVLGLLTQFGRLEGQELKRATRAVLDYSAATGVDAVTAATQLSNVIVKGTGRLAGINTKFDEGATAADRYAKVMGQLESIQGTAESRGKTFEGGLAQIGIEFERLEEAIGKNIIQSEAFRTVMAVVAKLIKTATGIVTQHGDAMRQLIVWWAQGALFITKLAVQFAVWETELVSAQIRTAEFLATIAALVAAMGAVAAKKLLGIDATGLAMAAAAAAKLLPTLERARAAVGEFGAAGNEALKALDDALQTLKVANVDVAGSLPKTGSGLKTVQTMAEQLDETMKRLGGPTLEALENRARDVDEALRLVAEAQAASAHPELYDPIIESLIEITEHTRGWTSNLSAAQGQLRAIGDFSKQLKAQLGEGLTQGAVQFGDAFVDALFGAKVSWGDFFKQMLIDITKLIVKMLILKAIQEATGGGAGGGGFSLVSVHLQHGGQVRGGIAGRDSVAAMLTPGEVVLPRSRVEDFEAMTDFARDRRAGRSAASSSDRPSLLGAFNILPRRDDRDIADIIEGITKLVERRGYRLVASEVRA